MGDQAQQARGSESRGAYQQHSQHDTAGAHQAHRRRELVEPLLIGVEDYTRAVVVISILGPLLTLVPTLALTRKYLKV